MKRLLYKFLQPYTTDLQKIFRHNLFFSNKKIPLCYSHSNKIIDYNYLGYFNEQPADMSTGLARNHWVVLNLFQTLSYYIHINKTYIFPEDKRNYGERNKLIIIVLVVKMEVMLVIVAEIGHFSTHKVSWETCGPANTKLQPPNRPALDW